MKNKKMLYLLIPGTLIVWGLIIYKIVANMHSVKDTTVLQNRTAIAKEEMMADTFTINPTYRDPFLGKVQQSRPLNTDAPRRSPTPAIPVAKVMTPWPNVIYHGIIKNQKLKKEMVLLEIDGREYMMKVGEAVNGVLLSKAFKDSVELQFSKEKKFIHK